MRNRCTIGFISPPQSVCPFLPTYIHSISAGDVSSCTYVSGAKPTINGPNPSDIHWRWRHFLYLYFVYSAHTWHTICICGLQSLFRGEHHLFDLAKWCGVLSMVGQKLYGKTYIRDQQNQYSRHTREAHKTCRTKSFVRAALTPPPMCVSTIYILVLAPPPYV